MGHELVGTAEVGLGLLGLLFVLITLCSGVGIIIYFRKANRELVKARMFLGNTLMRMWIYSTFAGGFFVVFMALTYLRLLLDYELNLLYSLTGMLFAASYFVVAYSWYSLFKQGMQGSESGENKASLLLHSFSQPIGAAVRLARKLVTIISGSWSEEKRN